MTLSDITRYPRYVAQWFFYHTLALAAGWYGILQLFWKPEKRKLFFPDNFGFDASKGGEPKSMKGAWARILYKPLSPHDWKNIGSTWTRSHPERASKWYSFLIVNLIILLLIT